MSKLEISSSGDYNEYIDGELINNSQYVANYDGDTLDLAVKTNDDEYYTQLDNSQLLDLLDNRYNFMDRDNIFVQLKSEFPLKSKSMSKKKSKKKSNSRKLTKRQKLHLIDSVF